MTSPRAVYLAGAALAAIAWFAAGAHMPQSNGYYDLPGSNGTAIVIDATSSEPAALYSLVQTPGVEGIRRIATPWPLIVGKAAFSLGLYFWNLRDSDKSMLPEWLMFAVKYLFNFVPSAGSLGFMVNYLVYGGKIPSYGVIVTLFNFCILKYPSEQANGAVHSLVIKKHYVPLCYIECCVVGLGMMLYATTGLVALGHGGLDSAASVAIAVDQGCPAGVTKEGYCADVGRYSFSVLTESDGFRIAFWAVGALATCPYFLQLYKLKNLPRFLLPPQASPAYKKVTFLVILITILLAILSVRDSQIFLSSHYHDCSAAIQAAGGDNLTVCFLDVIGLPGDTYGFWNFWVQYKVAVLEGIFAW